ncbi:ABC transporter [Colletotrichum musicola]|uniref:ABC transporter n=1 Tax=Colletotrichum musicola TaxID=2175873 RepID=A0A8H6KNN1_9PEZI|nr:ABC transporter [Colletotrichum musicola]
MACSAFSDRSFGPRVDPDCRSFDFTLRFEDIFFACLPSALFILLAPSRIALLLRQPTAFSLRSKLLAAKLVTLTALLASQIAFLALRTQNQPFQTSASVAADVLSFLASIVASLLSILTHQRSLRPSTLLGLYLSASIILGVARVRTLWLLEQDASVPAVLTIGFVLTTAATILESIASKKTASDIKHSTPEQCSGFWARTCFFWLAQTFSVGYRKVISLSDLPDLDSSLESRVLHKGLATAWDKYDHRRHRSLLRACFRSYLIPFLAPVIPRLCLTVFTFAQPFLINTTVTFVGQETPDANFGRGLIGAWALVYVGIAVTTSIFHYHNVRFTTRLRGGLIALVYHQAVNTREVDTGDITAVTLMGTDVERIFHSMGMVHMVWGSLLDIIVASWLLGLQLSLACLAPIVLVLVFIAAMSKISVPTQKAQTRWIERIQERLKVTTAMLGEMKAVKMLGLTKVMDSSVQKLRNDEISTSKSFRKLLVATLLLSLTPINLAPIVTFAVYTIISVFWKNDTLLPAQAFTSIALISLLSNPVVLFIQLLPMVVQSFACFDRVQDFCNYGPAPATTGNLDTPTPDGSQSITDTGLEPLESVDPVKSLSALQSLVVSFRGETLGWKQDQPVLHDLNVDIHRAAVTVVVGPVGSGKSTFLSAVLGDLIPVASMSKSAFPNSGSKNEIAYCSQSPWLENTSIQRNILGVSSYEPKWYDTVVSACGLDADLQTLPMGDNTPIGSKGVSLSGGQKQRIVLARAVYSKRRVVVLDDVFSGMDAHTSHHVSRNLLGPNGLLRRNLVSVVAATHSHKIMALADTIISLEDGRIGEIGSPATLSQSGGYVHRLGLKLGPSDITTELPDTDDDAQHADEQPAKQLPADQPTHTDIRRKNGEMSVYKYYLASAGWKAVTLYAVSCVMWVFFTEFSTVWVKWWSERNAADPNKSVGYYMGIYAAFGVMGTLCASLACWFAFVDIISNSAVQLHSDLLRTTLASTFHFLTKTDSGEILNRFSEDMQLLDMDLPSDMVNYTSTAVTALAKIVIMAVFSQYLGITIPFFVTILYFLQRFYLQTSRQVRLLGIEAKASLYTHFSESVAGAATVRAFGWQRQYEERNYRHIDTSQRPGYTQSCIQYWLMFVLNLLVAVLAVVLVVVVVIWHDRFSAGSVGVSLVMVIGFSETLARVIQSWTKLESSVGAAARVRRFVMETETEASSGKREIPEAWPRSGALGFSNVVASYGPDTEPVLKGVSLAIEAGQHVAICGRSGSGKTSLILSLLQMTDMREGKFELDGVDVSTLVPAELRTRINVVSQDAFLMPGSIRLNLDPFGEASDDEEIARALQRVGLWRLVQDQGGLDQEMDVAGWSAGQKQLLCLARAVIRKSKILILDEAMSSVDGDTESVMQDVVDAEFRDCTVLAVMHRLKHVSRYDKVALLGDGQLLEYGSPSSLISGETKFAELFRLNKD